MTCYLIIFILLLFILAEHLSSSCMAIDFVCFQSISARSEGGVSTHRCHDGWCERDAQVVNVSRFGNKRTQCVTRNEPSKVKSW